MYNSSLEYIKSNISLQIFKDRKEASIYVANKIAVIIEQRNNQNLLTVLGLATSSFQLGVYSELIRLHQNKSLSYINVINYNLDEYYPIMREDMNSYYRFMYEHFFNHIDIKPENINIPNGKLPLSEVEIICANYDQKNV